MSLSGPASPRAKEPKIRMLWTPKRAPISRTVSANDSGKGDRIVRAVDIGVLTPILLRGVRLTSTCSHLVPEVGLTSSDSAASRRLRALVGRRRNRPRRKFAVRVAREHVLAELDSEARR